MYRSSHAMDPSESQHHYPPFHKIGGRLISIDGYNWCSVKVLGIDQRLCDAPPSEIMDALIQSPFHLWQGEVSPSGTEWTWNGKPLHIEAFGPWDRTKMTHNDYRRVSRTEAECLLRSHLLEHMQATDDEVKLVADFVENEVPLSFELWHLALAASQMPERGVTPNVFDNFIAFIGHDLLSQRTLILEAGQD